MVLWAERLKIARKAFKHEVFTSGKLIDFLVTGVVDICRGVDFDTGVILDSCRGRGGGVEVTGDAAVIDDDVAIGLNMGAGDE